MASFFTALTNTIPADIADSMFERDKHVLSFRNWEMELKNSPLKGENANVDSDTTKDSDIDKKEFRILHNLEKKMITEQLTPTITMNPVLHNSEKK